MAALSRAAAAAGYRLVHFDLIGSTNALALERAGAGEACPVWFLADRQSAGRGRRGRAWVSGKGNLFATLLLANPGPQARTADLCFVAALALDDALLTLAPELAERFRLKWPNDGLIDGAKVAGILVEATSRGANTHVAIGIGVNVAEAPDHVGYAATSLHAAGAAVDRDQLFEALTASFPRALDVWRAGQGFAAIRAGWLSRAAGLGHPVELARDGQVYRGIFAGLDDHGRLVLEADGQQDFIAAGEIVALGQAGAGRA